MQVRRAKTAGFCMGVGLALKKLDQALAKGSQGKIYTLGPLIHNPQVLKSYEAKGVVCAEAGTNFEAKDLVVIRAHGIPEKFELALRKQGVTVIDATCPRVKNAQLAIAKSTAKGAALLLFGEADHPEVRGLISYAKGPSLVVGSDCDLSKLKVPLAQGLVLASQTTQDREAFLELERRSKAFYPELVVLSTICDATRHRQEEARAIAEQVEIMVVVGGRQSGNTRRLADVAAAKGIETILIETQAELKADFFAGKSIVGLTAGASTPKDVIDATEECLKQF
ncbi:MAG: 4-hydroxy-3-methylbut-2-enyl diphosphate reductase [Desulfovibrio sp.]|nr:4-hydroxy-3-methylbut-2-enyl diphosphate reductase [Desulfovibrio sp.]